MTAPSPERVVLVQFVLGVGVALLYGAGVYVSLSVFGGAVGVGVGLLWGLLLLLVAVRGMSDADSDTTVHTNVQEFADRVQGNYVDGVDELPADTLVTPTSRAAAYAGEHEDSVPEAWQESDAVGLCYVCRDRQAAEYMQLTSDSGHELRVPVCSVCRQEGEA